MALSDADRETITAALDRDPTAEERALFENLWSEHCAYRSSRPLLEAFRADSDAVVVGPGDDAGVVAVPRTDVYLTIGIESHNHPSYVDPYDGAATGVGGIVRDILSMGAYPIGLADSLYFGPFETDESRYLFEGVVDGIADYGNAIGVPTVAGSVDFHPGYDGNPLVNVACLGLTDADRLLRGAFTDPGNAVVLVGNATGRDGLGGASFASEALDEDAATEDRPAVQVGDPYSEKLLIEANERLLDEDLVVAARDLGAAGLGGATSEMAAQGDRGAEIVLDQVHQREPGMSALELLLAESQERMCYEVPPEHVEAVQAVAARYDLGCSVVGTVTDGRYRCVFEEEVVVDVPAELLADGAPTHDLDQQAPAVPATDLPTDVGIDEAFDAVVGAPNTARKDWVYRQYDHEVGARTVQRPGHDAAVLALRESEHDVALAVSAGAAPNWTAHNPRQGARAVAIENATNLAVVGAEPLAAVDCLNAGTPEDPSVYGAFAGVVEGLAAGCEQLDVPVVGGNVSLYNDSPTGPIPPTPTVAMVGTKTGYDVPSLPAQPGQELLLVGRCRFDDRPRLGGSEYLQQFGGTDSFPVVTETPRPLVETTASLVADGAVAGAHDISEGGLAVALAELVTETTGVEVELPTNRPEHLFVEHPGRVLVQTSTPSRIEAAYDGVAPVHHIGATTNDGTLHISVGAKTIHRPHEQLVARRNTIPDVLQ